MSNLEAPVATSADNVFQNFGSNTGEEVKIKIENWNLPNVLSMDSFFMDACNNRENVDLELSDMITPKLTDMTRMFNQFGVDSKVVKIKLDSIDTSNVTTVDYVFSNFGVRTESIEINGLNDLDLSKVETMRFFLSNVPELSIGTLDIYADDIYCILNNSQVKGILNIHNKPTSFDSALDIKSEGELTVNYSIEVDNIDQIIATANGNPKVIKGSLID